MQKYPDVLGAKEFFAELSKIKGFGVAVLQYKYDGSNILKLSTGEPYKYKLYTRNLHEPPESWVRVIEQMFPEIPRSKYSFYLEFGGFANAPAGYRESWRGEWDYVVIDDYDFRYPLDHLRAEGLRVVETIAEFTDVYKAVQKAVELLKDARQYEGIVVKLYGVQGARRGVLFGKVKHDNVDKWTKVLKFDEGEEVEEAPPEEVRKEVHKILVERYLSKGLDVSRATLNDIWPALVAELAKHGYTLSNRELAKQILRELKRELSATR